MTGATYCAISFAVGLIMLALSIAQARRIGGGRHSVGEAMLLLLGSAVVGIGWWVVIPLVVLTLAVHRALTWRGKGE